MYAAIGVVILLVTVFGGFAITGGALGPVMHAIPHEMLIIGGAAVGAIVTGNSMHELKALGGSFGKIFKGPKHNKQDHIDAIILTTRLMKILRSEGPVALESHVQEPQNSPIFAEFPRLLANKALVSLICDTLTLIVVSSGTLEVHAVEEVMDNAMKSHFHEMHEPQHALTTLADSLPALGIVAAVLGIVKTMGSITEPPEVLGGMIGGALVGTFLGVFVAYGFFGPMAQSLRSTFEAESKYFLSMKVGLLAHISGYPPAIAIEFARKALMSDVRPTFAEIDEATAKLPALS